MAAITRKDPPGDHSRVQDVMTHLVVCLRPDEPIREAARRLLANRISGAPVVQAGHLVGVVSEVDLTRAFTSRQPRGTFAASAVSSLQSLSRIRRDEPLPAVGQVMTTRVVAISPAASVWEAASLLDRHGVRRLPVVDDEGYVVGVVARADLVRFMARRDDQGRPGAMSLEAGPETAA